MMHIPITPPWWVNKLQLCTKGCWFIHLCVSHSWQALFTLLWYKTQLDINLPSQCIIISYFIRINILLLLLFLPMINSSTKLPFYYRKLMKSSWPYGSLFICKLYPLNNQVAICIHHLISWIVWQEYNRLQLHKHSHMVHKFANGLLWLSDDCIMARKMLTHFILKQDGSHHGDDVFISIFEKIMQYFIHNFYWILSCIDLLVPEALMFSGLLSFCPPILLFVHLSVWLTDRLTNWLLPRQRTNQLTLCLSVLLSVCPSWEVSWHFIVKTWVE